MTAGPHRAVARPHVQLGSRAACTLTRRRIWTPDCAANRIAPPVGPAGRAWRARDAYRQRSLTKKSGPRRLTWSRSGPRPRSAKVRNRSTELRSINDQLSANVEDIVSRSGGRRGWDAGNLSVLESSG